MKKWIKKNQQILKVILLILVGIAVIVGIFFISENIGDRSNDKTGTETAVTNPLLEDGQVIDEEKMKEMESITFEEFKEYLNKKTTTVIMLGYDDCYWCQQQKPILQMLMYEKDIDVKYLDISKITSEENSYIVDLHEDLEGYGTPTFISVKNKKVVKVSPNAKSTTGLIEMFTDMGILK